MFTKLLACVKARKAMRLVDRAQKLENDVLNFLETEPTSIKVLVMLPINMSLHNVLAASVANLEEEKKKIDDLKKENKEKKEE